MIVTRKKHSATFMNMANIPRFPTKTYAYISNKKTLATATVAKVWGNHFKNMLNTYEVHHNTFILCTNTQFEPCTIEIY